MKTTLGRSGAARARRQAKQAARKTSLAIRWFIDLSSVSQSYTVAASKRERSEHGVEGRRHLMMRAILRVLSIIVALGGAGGCASDRANPTAFPAKDVSGATVEARNGVVVSV